MIRLSYPTLTAIAKALVEHRHTRAAAVTRWTSRRTDPYAASVAETYRAELAGVDAALLELQAAVPPYLSDFLKLQIDLINSTAAAPQPAHQEAP